MKIENPIYVLIGPSGSGKTSILQEMLELCNRKTFEPNINHIVSHTTRERRDNEIDGYDYYFVDEDEFDSLDKIEEVSYNDYRHCLAEEEVEKKINEDCLYTLAILTLEGYRQLKKYYYDTHPVYVSVPKLTCLVRLIRRDGLSGINRWRKTLGEFRDADDFPFGVHNVGNLESNAEMLFNLLKIATYHFSQAGRIQLTNEFRGYKVG